MELRTKFLQNVSADAIEHFHLQAHRWPLWGSSLCHVRLLTGVFFSRAKDQSLFGGSDALGKISVISEGICRVTARRQRQRTSTPQVLSSLGCGSRHIMAGASAASAWSCRRTGSRSPSVARCRMQRASSLARTFSMPLHLSVNQASSNAASRIASVLGSNDPLPSPRMFPLSGRILLEAGPPEHHHDMATLWSLPAMELHTSHAR
jgi:hypothetical protein